MSENVQNNDVVISNVSPDDSRVTGCVKWFNNKAGYGFVTVLNGPHTGDVFVHHSAINVIEEQYRFLVQGEYVEFECVQVDNGPHKWQASNVTGPGTGRLMCETRHVMRSSQPSQVQPSHSSHQHDVPSQEWQVSQSRRHSHQSSVSQEHPQRARRPYPSQRPQQQQQGQGHLDSRHPSHPPSHQQGDEYEWLLVRKQQHDTRPPIRRVRRVSSSQTD